MNNTPPTVRNENVANGCQLFHVQACIDLRDMADQIIDPPNTPTAQLLRYAADAIEARETLIAELEAAKREAQDGRLATSGRGSQSVRELLETSKDPDWQQVVLNGGPPCFHVDKGKFCFRAKRWPGHDEHHKFIPLEALIAELEAAKADIWELEKKLGKAERLLEEHGYRRCDIAACNCGGYHHG